MGKERKDENKRMTTKQDEQEMKDNKGKRFESTPPDSPPDKELGEEERREDEVRENKE